MMEVTHGDTPSPLRLCGRSPQAQVVAGGAREVRSGAWLLMPYKHLWIAIDEETRGFRGGYRTIEAAEASMGAA